MQHRETFGSRFAVIMALAGSAIGLGNIWRFPYTMGQGGGAAFILVYLLSCLLLSMPIFLTESLIGRGTHLGTIGAMDKLAPGSHWRWLGILTVISPLIILSYYSVVGGWSIDYLIMSLEFKFKPSSSESIPGLFSGFASSVGAPLICHAAFLGLTALIVLMGVKNGIERFATYTMPVLFVLMIVMMITSLSLPGAGEGVRYLLKPDFSKLNAQMVSSAVGQSFFTLSLGVGTILTYSSYIDNRENLLRSGLETAGFDLLFALIGGFAVIPAVFYAGIEPGAGPGLVFETLPYIFSQMGIKLPWLGNAVAILFFFSILIAALTSSISMLEVGVAYLTEQKKFSRGKAVAVLFLICWILGILCSLSFGPLSDVHLLGKTIFEFCDSLTSDYLMAFGGLLFTLFAGWKLDKSYVHAQLTNEGSLKFNSRIFPLLYFLIRYVAPIGIIMIFITNLIW